MLQPQVQAAEAKHEGGRAAFFYINNGRCDILLSSAVPDDQVDVVHVNHGEDPQVAVQDPHHHRVEGHGEEGACRRVPLLEPRLSPDDDVLLRVDGGVSQGSRPPIVGLDDG
eukprot:3002055-Rhodomonas_salina.2